MCVVREYHGTLFFLNLYDRMSLTCIEAGSKVCAGDKFAYVIILRGKDSCLRFQSLTNPFEKSPMGKRCGIAKDFVTVPPFSFARDGSVSLEICLWSEEAYCPNIEDKFVSFWGRCD